MDGKWWVISTTLPEREVCDLCYTCPTTAENTAENDMTMYCPYPDCGFPGTDSEVDEHRTVTHQGEAQEGSNLPHRPRG